MDDAPPPPESDDTRRPAPAGDDPLRAFLEHLPAVAWVKDEDGRYVYISPTFEERFRITLAGVRGKTDLGLWPADLAHQFRENDLRVLSTGRPLVTVERGVSTSEGGSHWWTVKFPFADAGGRRYVGGMAVDITAATPDRAHLEELVTMCSWTRKLKLGDRWVPVEEFLRERLGVTVSHGMSDEALRRAEAELPDAGLGGATEAGDESRPD